MYDAFVSGTKQSISCEAIQMERLRKSGYYYGRGKVIELKNNS
jgi:hypothetical protein